MNPRLLVIGLDGWGERVGGTSPPASALAGRVILAVGRRFLSDPGSEVGVVRRFRDPPADPASGELREIGAALEMPIGAIGPTRLRLRGQLSPPAAARVDVQRRDGATLASVIADDFGRFVAELPSRGTIRLRLTGQLGPGAIETAWIAV